MQLAPRLLINNQGFSVSLCWKYTAVVILATQADFTAPFKMFYRACGAPSAAVINTDICDVLFSIQSSSCSVLIYHHSVKPTRLQFIQICVFVQKWVGWTAAVFLSFQILLPSFPFSTHCNESNILLSITSGVVKINTVRALTDRL